MIVRIEKLLPKKVVGRRLTMSLANNRTGALWASFMPSRHTVKNSVSDDLFSIQVFKKDFEYNNLTEEFEKWAAIEVNDFEVIPVGMDTLTIPEGPYAVFLYIGSAADGRQAFNYIFKNWLPSSGYEVDNRPHFERLGKGYKNNDPSSEEEIWIPIKTK